jgi:hypothetical protein
MRTSDRVSSTTAFRSTSEIPPAPVREKFSRLLTISLARKVCLTIFSISCGADRRGHLLGQHLDVIRDHRERRVDFVRDAGGEQSERREFLVLQHLFFEADTLGDVVEQDQPADASAGFSPPAGDRALITDSRPARLPSSGICRGSRDAVVVARAAISSARSGWKHFFQLSPQRFVARQRRSALRAAVPGFDAPLSRSVARTPTLRDSTIFSLKSLRRSICKAFCSSEE